jgi:hypothetical protein
MSPRGMARTLPTPPRTVNSTALAAHVVVDGQGARHSRRAPCRRLRTF